MKKQNERLRKMREKITRDDGFGDTLDMKNDLIDRISNRTGNGHYIPGSPNVAELTPDVIIAKGIHDYQDNDPPSQSGPEGDSRTSSPFELQLLDNSPRSSIYHPRSRGNPSPGPWNEAFKCSDSDSYKGSSKRCPLHSNVSNPSSDMSHSDYSDSTTSSIDYVSHRPPSSPYSRSNNAILKQLLPEENSSTSESDEDVSEATVKHKTPSPRKSLTSPSKLQSNKIGKLSDDPAILAYAASPKMRRSTSISKTGVDSAETDLQKLSPKSTTAV